MPWGWNYRPYVSVAQRRSSARRYAAQLAKKGHTLQPVELDGRAIARTFWGQAWCDNLESYSDFANRLPRGRTYVRNGSVIDLQILAGTVTGLVSGSEVYRVKVEISPLARTVWRKIKTDCAQQIDSLIDLLQGRFSRGVMERLTRQREGLFPQPREIKMQCSCPDWAVLCKHVAAVLYGVGARLDDEPELLFKLREVDHLELIEHAVSDANLDTALSGGKQSSLAGEDLGQLFGIELDTSAADQGAEVAPNPQPTKRAGGRRPSARKVVNSGKRTANPKKKVVEKKTGGKETKKRGKKLVAEKRTVQKKAAKKRGSKMPAPGKTRKKAK